MPTGVWNYVYELPCDLKMSVEIKAYKTNFDTNISVDEANNGNATGIVTPTSSNNGTQPYCNTDSTMSNAHYVFTTTSTVECNIKVERAASTLKLPPPDLSLPPQEPQNHQNPHVPQQPVNPHEPQQPQNAQQPQPSPQPTPANKKEALTPAENESMLNAHNEWRQRNNVPPLKCSANFAQDWANNLAAQAFQFLMTYITHLFFMVGAIPVSVQTVRIGMIKSHGMTQKARKK